MSEIERFAAQKRRGELDRYAELARRFSQRVLLPKLVAELGQGRQRKPPACDFDTIDSWGGDGAFWEA